MILSINATGSAPVSPRRQRTEAGSTIIVVMLVVSVLSVVAGGIMFSATARYHSTYQSASWQEALIGSEAGIDLAMSELRRTTINGTAAFQTWATNSSGGTAYPDNGRVFPSNNQQQPFLLRGAHGGEGATMLGFRVYVDVPGADAPPTPNTSFAQTSPPSIDPFINERKDGVPDNGLRRWYRIRGLGFAGVSGPARPSLDTRDNRLRKFSFLTDWRTLKPVPSSTGPYVSRLVETVAKPLTNFRNALMADKEHDSFTGSINLNGQDVLIDSYDSTKGLYDATNNHGAKGNLATNGTLINANSANVQGDAMTNNGTVVGAGAVNGEQRADFYQELTKVEAPADPAWATMNPYTLDAATTTAVIQASGGSVAADGTVQFTASTDPLNPTRIRLNRIDLASGTRSLSVLAPTSATGAMSYVKILVEGSIDTLGTNSLRFASGVNAIIYVSGNVNLDGHGIFNDSFRAGRLVINGIAPANNADGTVPQRSIRIATDQDFEGIVYAPSHDLTLALKAVPATSATGTSFAKQIADLQKDIVDLDKKNADETAKAASEWAKYQSSGKPSDLKNAQQAQAKADAALAAATAARQQLAILQGRNSAEADDHARGYNGVYGSFVGRTITVLSKTHVHYDEVLREAGPINHYEIVNWFEDQSSRATVNW